MKRSIGKHLSFANVMACFAVFIALGGSAYAVGKNTIGTKQLKNNAVTAKKIKKNAVTAKKIKKNAVTAAKIKNNSVTSGKIADGAVTGAKVVVASLGKVPSAASADTANTATSAGNAATADSATVAGTLAGQQNFFLKLNGGQEKVIATYGQVSLRAICEENVGGNDFITIRAETSVPGAVFAGDDDKYGGPAPDDFLNPDTPPDEREFESEGDTTDVPYVSTDIDSGFVLGPDGKAILANSEAIILGVNYLGSRCITGGVLNFIDAS